MRSRAAVRAFILMVLWATVAHAVLDPEPDGLGVCFTPDANTSDATPGLFMPFAMYVVLINPTFPQLHGWQAAVREADTDVLYVLSSSIPGDGINSGSGLQFSVGYDVPRPTSTVTVLASMQVMQVRLVTQSTCLILTGIDQPAIPDERPLVWREPGHPTVVRVSSPFHNAVAATINEGARIPESPPSRCSFVVDVAQQTWGALKSLYR